jgi:hypothetical protein
MIEVQPKKKRIRKRAAELQLQRALDDATVPDLSIASMKLIAARIVALSKLAAREKQRRLERVTEQLAGAMAENERLRSQHDADGAELERLRAVCRLDTSATFDDIATKGRTTNGTH